MLNKLLNEKAVIISLKAKTKKSAIKEIAKHLETNNFISSAAEYEKALNNREKQFSTGIGNEIAIPHAQSNVVKNNVVLIAKSATGIDWDSVDKKKVKYLFSIALNDKDKDKQVDTLQALSQALMNDQTKANLVKAKTKKALMASLVSEKTTKPKIVKGSKTIVAVTACPTGIAHTYMAQESIEKVAKELGYNYKVETQGRNIQNKLTKKDIDDADAIILAIDKGIDGMNRFANKKVLKIATKKVIANPKKEINNALSGKGEIIKASADASESTSSGEYSWSDFKNVYKNLMGGVSRMLPFVVAGGIILGIGFLLDIGNSGGSLGVTRDIARWFSGLGKLGLGIFVPILGGYVAYSIVGAEGLLPGFIAGLIASGGGLLYGSNFIDTYKETFTNSGVYTKATEVVSGWNNLWGHLTPGIDQGVLSAGSGFIGAMAGGYIAAFSIVALRKYVFQNVSKSFRGVVDVVGMPIFSVIITGALMFVVQIPLAYFAFGLKEGLTYLSRRNLLVLVTIIIGLMMAFDMGGPVNKVAYVFGTGLIGQQSGVTEADKIIMGAVMISGMTPPLGIAFSNVLFKSKAWTKQDREASKANWLLGAFFITEGAIPFAAKDPKRTIPSLMVGSAVAGLLVGLLKIGVTAPHGGIIVAPLYRSYLFSTSGIQIGMGITFLIASLAAGMATTGLMLGFWRSIDIKSGKLQLAK